MHIEIIELLNFVAPLDQVAFVCQVAKSFPHMVSFARCQPVHRFKIVIRMLGPGSCA